MAQNSTGNKVNSPFEGAGLFHLKGNCYDIELFSILVDTFIWHVVVNALDVFLYIYVVS